MSEIKIAAARQTGNLHLFQNMPCQDGIAAYRGKEAVCLVLADGAGSIAGSELASESVCRTLSKQIGDSFETWYAMENELLKTQLLRLASAAADEAEPGRKPDCTLLLTAISPAGTALCCHIGDGGIFFVCDHLSLLLSPPENGAEAHLTFFLSGKDAQRHLRIERFQLQENAAFLLCSDGIEPVLYDADAKKCAPAVAIIADWLQKEPEYTVAEVLDQHLDGIFREKTDDDMSLGIIAYQWSPDAASSGENHFNA